MEAWMADGGSIYRPHLKRPFQYSNEYFNNVNNAVHAYDLRWLSTSFTPAVSPRNLRLSQMTPLPPRPTISVLLLLGPGWAARVAPRPLSLHETTNLQQQGVDTVPNLPASKHCELGDVLARDLHKLERPEIFKGVSSEFKHIREPPSFFCIQESW